MGVTCSTVANRGKKGGMRWTYKKESELNTTTTHTCDEKERTCGRRRRRLWTIFSFFADFWSKKYIFFFKQMVTYKIKRERLPKKFYTVWCTLTYYLLLPINFSWLSMVFYEKIKLIYLSIVIRCDLTCHYKPLS